MLLFSPPFFGGWLQGPAHLLTALHLPLWHSTVLTADCYSWYGHQPSRSWAQSRSSYSWCFKLPRLVNFTPITVGCWIHPLQGSWAAQELSSAEHPKGHSSFSHCEEAAGFLLLHSSQLKPLCIALESCRVSSLIVFKELQRGSCDSFFQLYFYWKLENIHCHPSHLPAACLCCLQLTDPNKIPRNWGKWEEHQLLEVPGPSGATCPADSLLGFLTQKLSEKLPLFT